MYFCEKNKKTLHTEKIMLQDASIVFNATTIQTVGNSYGEKQNCTLTESSPVL